MCWGCSGLSSPASPASCSCFAPTQVGAIDFESKCTEAALTNVQTADFRHFAHGRHHWIAKRGDQTAVLALCGEEDSETAGRTLSLLPGSVPVLRVDVPHRGWVA